jgi:8-oxo-dGTP pyrophosphatase MutT (NUDIX family)
MMSVTWDLVHDALRLRKPARVEEPVATRAAVAAILRGTEETLELLFMRRAELEGDPWSGHISFPGGRAEPGEEDPLQTAVRETREETGIDLGRDAELLGPLDEIRAMARGRPVDLSIAPFVFRLLRSVNGTPNHEVVSLHWLPLARLLAEECRSTMEYEHEGTRLETPCLRIDELVIWGLTYRMFDNLRQLVEAAAAGPQTAGGERTAKP